MIGLPFNDKYSSELNLYILFDSALIDGFYMSLSNIDKLNYKSLFIGTSEESSATFGPVLVELKPDIHSSLISTLITYQTTYPTPIWLQTSITFTPLFNTLRKLLHVEKEDGSQYFFRYYDQLCFPGFWQIVTNHPDYTGMMRKIDWAIWQTSLQQYQYYTKNKMGDALCR